ncbi:zinc-binding alcohol dehydrogenase family protein [Pseudomonadota bacterium]
MKSNSWQFDTHGAPGEVLYWREQELPEPGPGQAWVKINAIGINRADLNYVLGEHFPAGKFPSCLGGEAVGEVVALGPRANSGPAPVNRLNLEIGARVGTFSGRTNCLAMGVYRDIGLYDHVGLAPVPESYSDQEGAALWTAMITMGGAMEMGGLTAATGAGKQVLITAGGSGMGGLALKLARHWGATTIATTRKAEKADGLGKLADHVIVCSDSDGLVEGVQQATNGLGVDLVLDPVGATFYPGLLSAVARGGDIVSYECITGTQSSISIMEMMMKNVSFHGFTTFRPFNNPVMLNRLIEIGMDNAQALRPVVSKTFDLSESPEALEAMGRSEHIGKMVIKT